MSGIVAMSIDPKRYCQDSPDEERDQSFVQDLFWTTFYQQHFGQQYAGLVTVDNGGEFLLRTHRGLLRETFANDLAGFSGPLGLGHISSSVREPYFAKSSCFPPFAICFAGRIGNREELLSYFIGQNRVFERDDDAFLLAQLIVDATWDHEKDHDWNFMNGIGHMAEKMRGSYAIAILTANGIYVARGHDAHESVVIGEKDGSIVAVSDSCGIYNQGFVYQRDLDPGEVVVLESGSCRLLGKIALDRAEESQPCSFKWIYTSNPGAVMEGLSAAEARRRLGARLARLDIEQGFFPDVIIPVPDSGRFHAIGAHQEYVRNARENPGARIPFYDEILCKYPYAGRSFTEVDRERRKLEALKKLLPILEGNYENAVVAFYDDSIVRGTQTSGDLLPKLKAIGLREVHARISSPKLVNVCPWGKANRVKNDLVALGPDGKIRTDEEIAELLGVDSCRFNLPSDVAKEFMFSARRLCLDCFIL
ncbi:hypothetical protein HQ571_03105 [Candidatus Kuenenbacteria bacterium]|nr:hypothetical protein [Candidatus Kuenenbacteria bacterium]